MSKEKITAANAAMVKEYGILQAINDLKIEENGYQGKVDLPCWKDYVIEGATPHDGRININIGQAYGDVLHTITTADVNGVAAALGRTEDHQQQILDKLLAEYPKWKPDYGYSEEDAKHFMPDVTSKEAFKNLIMLANVHVLPVEHEGIAYIGYEFNCQWDVEHGMGAMFHDARMVELGMAESSFMLSKAQSDKEVNTPQTATADDLVFDKIKVQQALYQFTVAGFKKRVAEKPDTKDIYAFAYDFDLLYNVVHLSMNTWSDHQATLADYESKDFLKDLLSDEAKLREVKFHPGNYRHCAFETFNPLTAAQHAQMEKWMSEDSAESKQKWQYNFEILRAAFSEILVLYSKGEEVKLLPVVADFYVCALDHEEDLKTAEERMKPYL
jgi:hypothetical protein